MTRRDTLWSGWYPKANIPAVSHGLRRTCLSALLLLPVLEGRDYYLRRVVIWRFQILPNSKIFIGSGHGPKKYQLVNPGLTTAYLPEPRFTRPTRYQ